MDAIFVGRPNPNNASKGWVEKYVAGYDSIALATVEKTSVDFIELTDVYKIQNNPKLYTTAPQDATVMLFYKSMIDKDILKGMSIASSLSGATLNYTAIVDNVLPEEVNTFPSVGEEYSGNGTMIFSYLLEINNWCIYRLDFVHNESPLTPGIVSHLSFTTSDSDPILVDLDITGDDISLYNTFWFIYSKDDNGLIQESYILPNSNTIKVDSDGNLDTSKITYPYTLAILDTDYLNNGYTISASYDTTVKIESTYNPESINAQSGVAVAEALNTISKYYPSVRLGDYLIQCCIDDKLIHLTGVISDFTLYPSSTLMTIQLASYGEWYVPEDEMSIDWYPWCKILGNKTIPFINCIAIDSNNNIIPVQLYNPDSDSYYAIYANVESETLVTLIIDSTYIIP